jgi:hypothetical protein
MSKFKAITLAISASVLWASAFEIEFSGTADKPLHGVQKYGDALSGKKITQSFEFRIIRGVLQPSASSPRRIFKLLCHDGRELGISAALSQAHNLPNAFTVALAENIANTSFGSGPSSWCRGERLGLDAKPEDNTSDRLRMVLTSIHLSGNNWNTVLQVENLETHDICMNISLNWAPDEDWGHAIKSTLLDSASSVAGLEALRISGAAKGVMTQSRKGFNLNGTPVVLKNTELQIEVDTNSAMYRVLDVKTGEVLLTEASLSLNTYLRQWWLGGYPSGGAVSVDGWVAKDDPQARVRCEFENAQTELGKGRTLNVVHTVDGKFEATLSLTLYDSRALIDCGWTVKNLGAEPMRVKQIDILSSAEFFPKTSLSQVRFLDGNCGLAAGGVTQVSPFHSQNNGLVLFLKDGVQQSVVAGGLTYEDFQKTVDFRLAKERLYGNLAADDPVGRGIDPGEAYISPDRLYLDLKTRNPFEALEAYGRAVELAQKTKPNAYTFPSVCMWFITVSVWGGDNDLTNDTVGAVAEMDRIAKSGILKYTPVAVRLVPDNYDKINEQGWWDEKHWQMHGRDERCIVPVNEQGGHYRKPYETSAKWCQAIIERGGIPITYFQPGIRSDDYAEAFPEHMTFNESHHYFRDANGEKLPQTPGICNKGINRSSYDYSDPGFLQHLDTVYSDLSKAGLKGIFFDYPDRAFPFFGGLEDRKMTASRAYRNVYAKAREHLGPVCYLQERLGWGSDLALGLIDSHRTEGDTNILEWNVVRKPALRWYKNRRLVNYDMDGKAILTAGNRLAGSAYAITPERRRTILTVSYAISGRLLFCEDFGKFSPEVIHDISRAFPFHNTPLSARPVDAFIDDRPQIFDFLISTNWHQLVLWNSTDEIQKKKILLSGDTVAGSLGLDPNSKYYLYDFWSNSLLGTFAGTDTFSRTVNPQEGCMISIHRVENHPQWVSTDRHLMQGYVDLVRKPVWNPESLTLSGTSAVIGNEPYRVTIALNGFKGVSAQAEGAQVRIVPRTDSAEIVDLEIAAEENKEVIWSLVFCPADGTPGIK